MSDERKVTYGDLPLAGRINSFKSFSRPTYLITVSPTPTPKVNPRLEGYLWVHCDREQSFYNVLGTLEAVLRMCQEEDWNVVVCAPSHAIAYALSELTSITLPENKDKTIADILSAKPKQVAHMSREFYLELGLYHGWVNNDEYCENLVNKCCNKHEKFELSKLFKLKTAALLDLEQYLGWEDSAESEELQ
jgi:hypothetical protein